MEGPCQGMRMNTKLDPIQESILRCTQFRGPVPHEAEVRRMAGEIQAALKTGALTLHDVRTLADCLETIARKQAPMRAV